MGCSALEFPLHTRFFQPRFLLLETPALARFLNDEAGVFDPANYIDLIADLHFEHHAGPIDLDHPAYECDRLADKGRAQVVDLNARAHLIFAVVQVFQYEVAAGMLCILHHKGCCVDPQVLAHKTDGALLGDEFRRVEIETCFK